MADDDGDWSSYGKIVFKRYAGNEAPGPLLLVDAAGGDPSPLTSGGHMYQVTRTSTNEIAVDWGA